MEKKKEVKVYRVEMMCDKCKQGTMKQTAMMYPAFPGQYEHQCDCCGYRTSYKYAYPRIEYEEIEEVAEENGAKKESRKTRKTDDN